MPIAWAKIVAAHLVKQVKVYNSGWCAGDTHLIEMPTCGDVVFEKDQRAIGKLEGVLAEVDEAVRLVLPSPDTPDETLKFRLRILSPVIKTCGKSWSLGLPVAQIARRWESGCPQCDIPTLET
jgi:hypothetical protein